MFEDERRAGVAADDDAWVDRDATEERQAPFLRRGLAAAAFEDVRLLPAVRADEAAHVLDHAQDVHPDGLRERDRLADVQQGYFLRGLHHDLPVGGRDLL